MKKNILSVLIVSALSLSIVPANKAEASGVPVVDFAAIGEAIVSNSQMLKNWAEEKAMSYAEMDLEAMLASLEIDSFNNAAANEQVRNGLRAQTIQNLKVVEMSMPDMDACETMASATIESESKKRNDDKKEDDIEDDRKKHNNFGQNTKEWIAETKDIIENTYGICESLQKDSLDPDNPMVTSFCTDGSLITGGSSSTLTPDQTLASKEIINMIIGNTPELKRSSRLAEGTLEKKNAILKEMRKEAFRDIARSSLKEVNAQFASSGSLPSPIASIEQFDKDRYLNPQWLKLVQNTGTGNEKNAVYTSEITRKIAVMNSFLVHMEVLKYKQAQRMEMINSAQLALMIEPL